MARVKSIEEQIRQIAKDKNLGKSATLEGKELNAILISEANRLKDILAKHIRAYYDSYDPVVYQRRSRYNMADALEVDASVKDKTISISFDEDMVWNDSVKHPSRKHKIRSDVNWGWGFEPILIDTGWRVKRPYARTPIHRFDYYEGYNFIQKAIAEFNSTNRHGLYVYVRVDPKANAEFSEKFELSQKAQDVYDRMRNF
ncbi:MAG: hypothetical protein J6S14_17260 [Clostridia bacterium]|nr:hypothetical protein [Clostridia bacterium]